MTRRNPPAKWVLPTVVNPPGRICYRIEVPDDPQYKAAFWGSLLDLASAYKWADDSAHTAKDVALIWREIIDNMRASDCAAPAIPREGIDIGGPDVELRLKPTDNCIIQINCAGEWEDWYDPRSCIGSSISQPVGSGGAIDPGVCLEYDVTLNANDVWALPAGVDNGDIITISNVVGGWSDGVLANFKCPSGYPYVLGACVPTTRTLVGTDPVPSAYHMELVGIWDTGGHAADNQVIVISGLSSPSPFYIQANDDPISDNFGSVTFHVKACSGAPSRVALSYLLGANGPADLGIGEEFDYNVSVFDGAAWNGGIEFDPCCSLTLISQTGSVVTSADWLDCGGGGHVGFNLAGVTKIGTNSSVGAFTLRLRLDTIP